jgi:glycosyltransferase involved in cell wall biosynthesis
MTDKGALLGSFSVRAETAYPAVVAGSRVRIAEMGTHLGPLGISLRFAPSMTSAEYSLVASRGLDLNKAAVLAKTLIRSSRREVQKADLTLVHRLRSLVPGLRERDPLDVYDFDDALYVGSVASHHAQLRHLKLEAARCVSYMRRARLVFAGNSVLADAARRYATRVEIVPSCVDPSLQPRRDHRESEILKLGWIGSRTTSPYLAPVLEAMAALHARQRPVKLVLMGADPSIVGPGIEHRTWSIEAERDMLTEIDVGMMPLPDDPWTRGKCGYKLLRYFSAGLPSIASPVGINAELVAGGGGLRATSSEDWSQAIEELLVTDPVARRQIGDQARWFVEKNYSYAVWGQRVAELLAELT